MIKINEADKPVVNRTIVIYSGRFQPFHRGHYDAYKRLVSKFGSNNVYIGTSDVTDNNKSPFRFREKKEIATKMFGVPSNRFVKLSNPYAPEEILNKYDGKTTQYIAAVGEKDAQRLAGKYFKPYKGKAGYGYEEIGYVYIIPPEPNPISGTEVRKGLGGSKENAKKFFLKAYPKFDKEIFDLITGKLKKLVSEYGTLRGVGQAGSFNDYRKDIEREKDDIEEDGFPGGVGIGLVLPGGYINGAPTGSTNETLNTKPSSKMRPEPHPTRHETEHPSDEPDWYKKKEPYTKPQNELYDPISQIIYNTITEDDFENFVKEYFEEKRDDPRKLGLVHLGYGLYGKKKGDEPTHKRDKTGKIVPLSDKEKGASQAIAKSKPAQPGQPVKRGQTPQGKIDKLSPTGMGTLSTKSPQQKIDKLNPAVSNQKKDIKQAAAGEQPEEPQKLPSKDFVSSAEKEDKEDKNKSGSVVDRIKDKVKDWSKEEKEFFKNKVHKGNSPERRSWGQAIMDKAKGAGHAIMKGLKHEVEEFKTAAEGVKELMTGKKLSGHHKKALKAVGIKIAVTALFGAAGGGLAHGLAGFGKHVAMELIPHAVGETLVKGVAKAAVFAEGAETPSTYLNIFAAAIAERMQNMKITPEMMEKMVDSYDQKVKNKKLKDKFSLNENISEIKTNNINDFVQYATQKLKLKETPKVTLIDDKTFGEQKHSLGGYNPDTKEIFVQTENRLSADILRTIAHEMVHRKQDELGLIKNTEVDGATGSPIENQANAVAGILLRNYGKKNKNIYTETIKKVGNKFVVYPKAGGKRLGTHSSMASAKKQLAAIEMNKEDISVDVEPGDDVLMGKFKNKKIKVKDISKDQHGMPTINGRQATTFRTLNETSGLSGEDDQPNGAWLPKNAIRELGANDGANKKDDWFVNGGYTQTDFPIADQILGDDDQNQIIVRYTTKNVPRTDFEKTKFNKAEDKIELSEYQKLAQQILRELFIDNLNEGDVGSTTDNGESFRSPYLPDWEGFDLNGQNYANIVGYEMIGHDSKHHLQKTNGSVLPVHNPKEENGPAKRSIHPSKGEEYAKDKSNKWEMYPFNTRPDYFAEPDVYAKPSAMNPVKTVLREGLLMEGGAYGHMSHPFDDMDLTFGDLKNIIKGALEGDLGVVREKTDGQALAISWKKGRLIAARNKSHLENAGANAMGIEGVASKFGGRGGLSDAYNFAMNDLNSAISGLSQKQKEKIFNEGKCFMNLEVIWPENANVIPYGQALLVFHNLVCYDESGNAVGADNSAARTLAGMIKQINADVQSKYTIQGPPITEIPKNQNLSSKQAKYISKLNKLQSEFNLGDNDTLALYHQSWWENFVDKSKVKLQKLEKEALVRRWAFGDKSLRLNTISDKKAQEWAIENDKVNVVKQQKDNMKPFEEIFLGVGADVLQFMSSVLTVHPEKALRSMKDEFKTVANQVRSASNPALIDKLKDEMKRLNALGGIKSIVPIEGIVFFYNGKTYKLTGSFAALNQILGLLKFSR